MQPSNVSMADCFKASLNVEEPNIASFSTFMSILSVLPSVYVTCGSETNKRFLNKRRNLIVWEINYGPQVD